MKYTLVASVLLFIAAAVASAQSPAEVRTQNNVVYAVHDGVSLNGDLYLPTSAGPHPAMLFIHGGGFRGGSKAGYGTTWGPYLAARGYVVFAIDYRLATPNQTTWPQALLDCKAALQYLRGNAAMLGIAPDRIGVGGDSAGASLAALMGVTQDAPAFANKYPKDAHASASTQVKVDVPIYGVHDMVAWERFTTPASNNGPAPLEIFFGGPPDQVPGRYFAASPPQLHSRVGKEPGRDRHAQCGHANGLVPGLGNRRSCSSSRRPVSSLCSGASRRRGYGHDGAGSRCGPLLVHGQRANREARHARLQRRRASCAHRLHRRNAERLHLPAVAGFPRSQFVIG